jgi:glycosyltransferase involved in cell wall biosynthesis
MTNTSPKPELTVVVPVYCSQGSLERLVAAIFAAFPTSPESVEVILVNDASTDASWEVMTRLAAEHPNLVCIDLRRNFGQDNAILTGLRHSRGDYVAIMDDDLQHDPVDLPRLLEVIKTGPDVVYATYRVKQQSRW